MKLATFGEIASFVHADTGQRLPIRYAAYLLGDAELSVLAESLVERIGDGGWARQLPPGILWTWAPWLSGPETCRWTR